MAKFYVQSGNFRRVVAADSSRKAAIWAVHEVMQQIIPTETEDAPAVSIGMQKSQEEAQTVTVLSGKVRVNERGFDRSDANEIPTMEVVGEWNQMVMTLDRLQRMFGDSSESGDLTNPVRSNRVSDNDFLADDMAA
ncbi:hypothetical protein [Neorhodopirellula lusitana]|uniref:hypothetical protein n=1 Tax=Neorhodopirellula lusitana TaxID=445327 RepID=UPI00384DBA9E